jgi:hypothetical protein
LGGRVATDGRESNVDRFLSARPGVVQELQKGNIPATERGGPVNRSEQVLNVGASEACYRSRRGALVRDRQDLSANR